MTRADFLVLLDELLDLPPGTLRGDEALGSYQTWDSSAAVSFLALADEHCGLLLSPRVLVTCDTVDDLVALLGDKIST